MRRDRWRSSGADHEADRWVRLIEPADGRKERPACYASKLMFSLPLGSSGSSLESPYIHTIHLSKRHPLPKYLGLDHDESRRDDFRWPTYPIQTVSSSPPAPMSPYLASRPENRRMITAWAITLAGDRVRRVGKRDTADRRSDDDGSIKRGTSTSRTPPADSK